MELVHSFSVPAHPERTWALLTDLQQVGSCFPGATVTEAGDEEFSGTVKVKLGPIAMMYSGSGQFVSRDDADHRATIEARGKDKRGNGTAGATVMLNLSPDGDGTKVDVKTELSITGKPAQFGRGVMQDVSDKLLNRFVDCVESQLGGHEHRTQSHDPVAASESTPAAEPESDAALSPAVTPAPDPVPPSASPSESSDDAIHLGSAVGPAVLGRYGVPLAVLAAGVVGYLVGRSGSRSGD